MGSADRYIAKNKGEFFFEPDVFSPYKIIVVIPCYNEPEIQCTILSLFECEHPGIETGIVVVVNSSVKSPEHILIQNRETISELNNLKINSESGFHLSVIEVENLPEKHGGVGWARKIGMDWAIGHFNHFQYDEGIIVSLDADTLVEKNYLKSIYGYFKNNPLKVAATIYFEHKFHPFDCITNKLKEASVYYELYMRYYRNALLYTGFSNSIYTVGSCFAVRAGAYIAQGGMNRRKAGEDFYFLQKISMLGEIGEINSTTVYPSSRLSDRVPFGTGPAIKKYNEGNHSLEYSYSLDAFEVLKSVFSKIGEFYKMGDELKSEDISLNASFIRFCDEAKLIDELHELKANCSSVDIFRKRFFHLFNAFKVLKWLNYSLQNGFPQKSLLNESYKLLHLFELNKNDRVADPESVLAHFRTIDKNRLSN